MFGVPSLPVHAQGMAGQVQGRPGEAAGDVEPAPDEEVIVVTVDRPVHTLQAPVEQHIAAGEAARLAGGQGDAAKVVQVLPGVAHAGGQVAEPLVWGAAPGDSGVYLDGVPLPFLFHGSGLRSVLPSGWLQGVRLVPGAYGVQYGRHLGGVLLLQSRDVAQLEVSEGRVSVDALDVAAQVAVPFDDKTGAAVGARYGLVSSWLPAVLPQSTRSLYVIPEFWGVQAQLMTALAAQHSLKVQLVMAGDQAQRTPYAQAGFDTAYEERRRFVRLYAVYERPQGRARTRITPYLGWEQDSKWGERIGVPVGSAERSLRAGLRLQHIWEPVSGLRLELGLDGEVRSTMAERRGSLAVPEREGDLRLFGQPPGPDYQSDGAQVFLAQAAPYLAFALDLGPLRLQPGLRVDAFVLETGAEAPAVGGLPVAGTTLLAGRWSPNLTARWSFAPGNQCYLALSRHYQPPEALDLGPLTGNPRLPPAGATHLVAGLSWRLGQPASLEVTAFRKWLSGLAVRTAEAQPAPAQLLSATGTGWAHGVQLRLVLRRLAGFRGWLAATLSRSMRRDQPLERERLFDYDQPLAIAAVLSRKVGPVLLSLRARYASGFFRPGVVGADYNVAAGYYEPVLSRTQGARLPATFALDLRAEYALELGSGVRGAVYLEGTNLTNQRNPEEVVYSYDYRQRTYLRGLPTLIYVGARLAL